MKKPSNLLTSLVVGAASPPKGRSQSQVRHQFTITVDSRPPNTLLVFYSEIFITVFNCVLVRYYFSSFSDPLWCATLDKATPTYDTSPYNYNSYAIATKTCKARSTCKAVVYKIADESWSLRKGTTISAGPDSIDYKYCRPSAQAVSSTSLQSEQW